jgi:hypothetical protein
MLRVTTLRGNNLWGNSLWGNSLRGNSLGRDHISVFFHSLLDDLWWMQVRVHLCL